VRVHVLPRSGRTEIVGVHDGALKIRVTAPPVDGRATEAARVAVAGALGVGTAAVTLVSGERSRLKRFRVAGLDVTAAEQRLAPFLGTTPG
jgi:uncharacterized protein (TIGR00251 family)